MERKRERNEFTVVCDFLGVSGVLRFPAELLVLGVEGLDVRVAQDLPE